MRPVIAKVSDIKKIKKDVYLFSFHAPRIAKKAVPGQFVHIKIAPRLILRRPFSVHYVKGQMVFILFRIRGRGTQALSRYKKGDNLDVLGPLGNGFNLTGPGKYACQIIIAGGMGVAPLRFLADVIDKGRDKKAARARFAFIGAKNRQDILCAGDFKSAGFKVMAATEDGSLGFKGNVAGLLKKEISLLKREGRGKVYACGPFAMFYELEKILGGITGLACEFSFEQFMGCGAGICHGCVIETASGYKRVCKEGPVFNINDIIWREE
ncbi:MAG: dihydroorotate dehydrogenase electron transfer subunit [Candidatus Omnitrophota bacterium]